MLRRLEEPPARMPWFDLALMDFRFGFPLARKRFRSCSTSCELEEAMKTHPYLRAYMAGIVVPSVGLLVVMTVLCVARLIYRFSTPIERLIVIPMALVPNLFGVWNMLYVWLRPRRNLPIGLHGALLPNLVVPITFAIAMSLGFLAVTQQGLVWFQAITIRYPFVVAWFLGALIVYYLVWKYLVGFFNELLGIA
jgi:hypothetical protein